MTWEVYERTDGNHVVPQDDLREHVLTIDCWCRPKVDESMIIHNSKDQRELGECDHAHA